VAGGIAEDLSAGSRVTTIQVPAASETVACDVAVRAREEGADLLLSVGGGSVVDVGKRVHRQFGLPHVTIPTIIANDGLVSPISVLRTDSGRRESLPAAVPIGAVVDLDVIQRSPRCYLVAAAGDVLSNLSASYDWLRLFRQSDDAIAFNDLAYELAVGAAEALVGSRSVDFDDDAFLLKIVRAQISSGLAMSLAGTSRPCSGAEHLLSHAIDYLQLGGDQLHGLQVGSISLFVLSLLRPSAEPAMEFATRIGLPMDWTALSPAVSRNLESIIATARRMRPDRRTILDDYTDAEVVDRCRRFALEVPARPSARSVAPGVHAA
jgi:glycerol-1-phosphate dehydrogenase [NAD(P)+]